MRATLLGLCRRMQGVNSRLQVAGVECLHYQADALRDGEIGEETYQACEEGGSDPGDWRAGGSEGVGCAGEG